MLFCYFNLNHFNRHYLFNGEINTLDLLKRKQHHKKWIAKHFQFILVLNSRDFKRLISLILFFPHLVQFMRNTAESFVVLPQPRFYQRRVLDSSSKVFLSHQKKPLVKKIHVGVHNHFIERYFNLRSVAQESELKLDKPVLLHRKA